MSALSPHPYRKPPKGPVVCVVMDGVGIGAGDDGDAVRLAHTPTIDWLASLPSSTRLLAHGTAVGLPTDDDMGNSEVGHNALGAGRTFDQGAKLVNNAIDDGSIWQGAVWRAATARVRESGQPLHFIGLLSDGGVHSHIDQLVAMLRRAASENVARVRVHILTDGRDVSSRSAPTYVERLESVLSELSTEDRDYRIASGGGRMFVTMDRYEADWSIVERGWQTHVRGEARQFASAGEAITTLYEDHPDKDDQTLPPFVIAEGGEPIGRIEDGAAVLFFNYRGDRAIEISRAFEEDDFTAFDRGPRPDVLYAGMMQYDGDLQVPKRFLVEPPAIADTMGEQLAATGKRQVAVAETQKYGHVTYFWNGNRSGAFDETLERYIEIPSDKVSFDQRPWMKAAQVTDALLAALREGPDFVRVNYANGDMVGHTGHLDATRVAVEVVDLSLARLLPVIKQLGGVLVVTADHGNADQMFDVKKGTKTVRTSHSLNPVMLSIYDPREPGDGPAVRPIDPTQPFRLANVAATCLELMGLEPPEAFERSVLAE